jgi:hypothetical protein
MDRIMIKIFPIFFFLILFSCVKGYGVAYVKNNLTVYYTIDSDLQSAKLLADFWFNNQLINNKKQFLRINYVPNKPRQIQLVANDPIAAKKMNFEELNLLQNIENQLNESIFKTAKIDLVLCDNRFNVVNDLNY